MKEIGLPLNLQFFAGAAGEGAGAESQNGQTASQSTGTSNQSATTQPGAAPQVDYAKIQQMLDGTLAAKEDTALKAYFKQQGLSQEEAEQAMTAFKQQKAAQQPDVNGLQTQLAQAQAAVQQAQMEKTATLVSISLGIEAKSIPYVLKMADLSQAMGQDGKINEESVKSALNKVLEDVPALKPQAGGSTGFIQVGAASGQTSQTTVDAELDRIFGVKKK